MSVKKTLLHHCLSEPEMYGGVVYRFKRLWVKLILLIMYFYNLNLMRQSACLMINPDTVNNFSALLNCKPVVSGIRQHKAIHFSLSVNIFIVERLLHGPLGLN